MLKTVKGHYNGIDFILDEDIQPREGQEFYMILLDESHTDEKKKRPPIDFSQFVGLGEKMFTTDAQEYVRELRDNDRI